MKKVFIKYNPYMIRTEITIDGEGLKENSSLGEKVSGSRLQEWIEDLPQILIDEYNDTDFDIEFHGTLLDYEDLTEAFTQAYEEGKLTAKIERKPAKETSDKEALIDKVFQKIQKGPYDELRVAEVTNAFENAKNSDFEVCVIATMSAGKSTLINSMLQTKLMPSKQEACTAVITRIKDNDIPVWQAEVYNKENRLIETQAELTYETMERLNGNENVSMIKVTGDIPFVTSEDISLVLIDTPGPNNSRNLEHKKVQRDFLNKSSKSLVLYIMEGTFGNDDDNTLLEQVAESMAVGGKQSKDRFIFVINKMDDRKTEDGSTEEMLERVRTYLKKHGINNPNLFPAAALPALNIRMIMKGEGSVDDEDMRDMLEETEVKAKKLNRKAQMHFEEYASLPRSIKENIKEKLKDSINAIESEENPKKDSEEKKKEARRIYTEALVHTGIVSVEAAIRQYVQKYAKTAKIKNIVDTFIHKLDAAGVLEITKKELASNQDESEKIAKNIDIIRKKMTDVNRAKKFEESVNEAVSKVNVESVEVVDKIILKFQKRIQKKIDDVRGKEIDVKDADIETENLKRFAKNLEPLFKSDLEDMIKENVINTGNMLLQEYRNKLASLTDGIKDNITWKIEPLELMKGNINSYGDFSTERFVKQKEVEDGEEWDRKTDKKWYKPWTWFQEDGYYRTKYKTVQYIDAGSMTDDFLQPIQTGLYDNGKEATEHAKKESKKILDEFKKEFQRLDELLEKMLIELESYALDKEQAEARIKESESRIKWLEEIRHEVESILEI